MSVARFDVAVIGAGPAGSSSAISLARRGHSVILVDKSFFPREKLCGDFLNPINWPIFEELGVAGELLSLEHEEVTAFRISACSGREIAIHFPFQNGQRPFGLGLSRSHLDDLLLRRAAKEGAKVRQGQRVTDLRRERNGWTMTVGRDRLRSTVLIGADGRNSWVAHRLGLARREENGCSSLAFQLRLRGVEGIRGEVQIHLFPGGYAGVIGLGGDAANLCFTVERSRIKGELSRATLFDNFLHKNLRLRELLRRSEIVGKISSAYPVYFSPRRPYGDGLLLVGDAARVTEPVTGEGVYFALKSGELAAKSLEIAFSKGNFSARELSSSQLLCQRAFSPRQRVNGMIRALIRHSFILHPLIHLSSKTSAPLFRPIVNFIVGQN